MALRSTNTNNYANNVNLAARVFEEHWTFIRAVIRSQVNNEAQADDIFQDFFLSLVYTPMPKGVKNIRGYLYRAITNDIVDAVRRLEKYQTRIRRYGKQLNHSNYETGTENPLIEREQLDKMFALIKGRLPSSESQAITSRYGNHNSIKEIAEKMKVDVRSVSRYISVGLRKIRQFLTIKRGKYNDHFQP